MHKKLCKYSIVLLIAAIIVSCSKVPRGILQEKKMKDVMIDVQLAEQLINDNYKAYPDSAHRAALFESVFRKHNITQAIYDSSLIWYGKNLNIMVQVLDLALDDINTRINNMGDVQAAPSNVSGDSVNIWPRLNYMTLYPEALFNGTVFDIKPEATYVSGSSFVLNMHIWGLKSNMQHLPEIRIAAVMQDTVITVNRTIKNNGSHSITLKTLPTKPIYRVYGYIRMDNAERDYFKIYVDSLSLIKYNYGYLMSEE